MGHRKESAIDGESRHSTWSLLPCLDPRHWQPHRGGPYLKGRCIPLRKASAMAGNAYLSLPCHDPSLLTVFFGKADAVGAWFSWVAHWSSSYIRPGTTGQLRLNLGVENMASSRDKSAHPDRFGGFKYTVDRQRW